MNESRRSMSHTIARVGDRPELNAISKWNRSRLLHGGRRIKEKKHAAANQIRSLYLNPAAASSLFFLFFFFACV